MPFQADIIFQSTLPRGERRVIWMDEVDRFPISIHAPTRGATYLFQKVSIPQKFQSTLPRGERPAFNHICRWSFCISIHAPTRGATALLSGAEVVPENFNPRSHERSDLHFQSPPNTLYYFNPRSHEGSDSF